MKIFRVEEQLLQQILVILQELPAKQVFNVIRDITTLKPDPEPTVTLAQETPPIPQQ